MTRGWRLHYDGALFPVFRLANCLALELQLHHISWILSQSSAELRIQLVLLPGWQWEGGRTGDRLVFCGQPLVFAGATLVVPFLVLYPQSEQRLGSSVPKGIKCEAALLVPHEAGQSAMDRILETRSPSFEALRACV